MARIKHFSDVGGPVELGAIWGMANKEFAERWPGIKGLRQDGFQKWVGRAPDGSILPVTRMIERKANPSLHECDARCLGGRHNGRCECRCGGKNHGAGIFSALLAAA